MAAQGARSETILVVGGGIAGITTAVEAAEAGAEVVLVERGPSLGGRVAQLSRYFPKLCHPTCGLEINYQRIRGNRRLRVITMATVAAVTGDRGAYTARIETRPRHVTARCTGCGDCARASQTRVPNPYNYDLDTVPAAHLAHPMAYPMRYVIADSVIGTPEADRIEAACRYGAVDLGEEPGAFDMVVGAVVWATGWRPYDAAKLQPYGYERHANVITNVEMERLAATTGPTLGQILRPSDAKPAKRVAMIQCAGSRDHNHLPYCSRICCLASLKHAAYLREAYADAEVDIYYIDIRAHDKLESFHARIKADPRVRFIKSKPASISENEAGDPVLHGEDTLTRDLYETAYDMVVLAIGMAPTAGDAMPEAALETDEYGFIVAAETLGGGMFSAGVAAGPLDVSLSVQSATAAALKAIQAVRGG